MRGPGNFRSHQGNFSLRDPHTTYGRFRWHLVGLKNQTAIYLKSLQSPDADSLLPDSLAERAVRRSLMTTRRDWRFRGRHTSRNEVTTLFAFYLVRFCYSARHLAHFGLRLLLPARGFSGREDPTKDPAWTDPCQRTKARHQGKAILE